MAVESSITEKVYMPGAAMLAEPLTGIVYRDPAEIKVEAWVAGAAVGLPLVRDLHYQLGGNGLVGAGTIRALDSHPVDTTFRIWREAAPLQRMVLAPQQPVGAKALEGALDAMTMRQQEQVREIGRTARGPRGETGPKIEPRNRRAGRLSTWSADGEMLESIDNGDLAALLVTDMTALLPAYLRGDPGGNMGAIGAFDALPTLTIPEGTDMIQSVSKEVDRNGLGGATYVSDDQANAALADAHPEACKVSANGRYFRLLPDAQGYISVEQMGCPSYAPGVNVQPFIQATIDYAHAMKPFGIKGVSFGQEKYELWTPMRKLGVNNPNGGPGDYSGYPIVISKKIALKSAPNGTELIRRKWNGRHPAEWLPGVEGGTAQPMDYINPNANIAPNGYTWRGGMIMLRHTEREGPNDPRQYGLDYTDLAGLVLEGRWVLQGGIPTSRFEGQYRPSGDQYSSGKLRPSDGAGWDWSDKPVWQSNLGWTGDIMFDYLEVNGFRGEHFYQGGELHGSIRGRRLICSDSDANGFNPGPLWCEDTKPGRVEIEHITIRDCFQGFEGGSGRGHAWFGLVEIQDTMKPGVLAPGDYNQNPMTAATKPSLRIGQVVLTSTKLVEGNRYNTGYEVPYFTHIGEIVATDCIVAVGSAQGNFYSSSIGRITMIAHKAGRSVDLKSDTESNNNYGLHRSQDGYVGEIVYQRTPYARANNIQASSPFTWANANYGPNLRIGKVSGDAGGASQCSSGTAVLPAYVPILEDLSHLKQASGIGWNIETTPFIGIINAHFMRFVTTSNEPGLAFTATLPFPTGKYDHGFRFKAVHYLNNGIVSIATANTRMGTRFIMLPGREYEFMTDGSNWFPVTPSGVLVGTVTAALQKGGGAIPAGDVSDEVTLAVNGARAGMTVRVSPISILHADAQLIGRVAGDNTVAIRARNLNLAAPLTLAGAQYRVQLEWAS